MGDDMSSFKQIGFAILDTDRLLHLKVSKQGHVVATFDNGSEVEIAKCTNDGDASQHRLMQSLTLELNSAKSEQGDIYSSKPNKPCPPGKE